MPRLGLYRIIGREPDMREGGSHINVNETIDKSVFERWRADLPYKYERQSFTRAIPSLCAAISSRNPTNVVLEHRCAFRNVQIHLEIIYWSCRLSNSQNLHYGTSVCLAAQFAAVLRCQENRSIVGS